MIAEGGAADLPAFIEITRSPPKTQAAGLEAVLPSGVMVRGQDSEQVARLVTAFLRSARFNDHQIAPASAHS